KIADDIRVGNRYRAALFDLLAEQGNYRAGRTQHIAKTYHGKARGVLALCQTLQGKFSHPLGGSHNIGGPYGFVRRNKYEGFNTGFDGSFGAVPGAEYIVAYTFDDVVLDQRHMLVGRRVIHRVDTKGAHNGFEAVFLLH